VRSSSRSSAAGWSAGQSMHPRPPGWSPTRWHGHQTRTRRVVNAYYGSGPVSGHQPGPHPSQPQTEDINGEDINGEDLCRRRTTLGRMTPR
jgi:hypothetical protein